MLRISNQKSLDINLLSHSGKIKCHIYLKNSKLYYEVYKDNDRIIAPSSLSLQIYGETPLNKFTFNERELSTHSETIEMSWGDTRYINNNYNEAKLLLNNAKNPEQRVNVTFRVFDNAVAFRYEIIKSSYKKRIVLKSESSEFNVDASSIAWTIPAYQKDRYEYNYEKQYVGDITGSVHTPLTIKTEHAYISIHEACLYDYGSMTIKNSSGILKSDITPLSDQTIAHIKLPFKTPWRLIMIADTAIELTTNRTMYALNDKPSSDFSWVKPLKFIGIWWAMYVGEWTWAPGEKHGATTEHAIEYLNYAKKLGINGLLIEGWNNGWEGDWLENGAYTDFTKPSPDFDLERIATLAKSKNINLIGHHETVGFVDNYEHQLEKAYNYYALNGVNYIKTGYSGSMMVINGRKEYHHSQLGVNHYQKTVELAVKKHICLDIHEPIKGTGLERTWPNLLSREGARGQEYEGGSIPPSHACNLPYTRLLSGGMDYTSGIFDLENPKKRIYTTLARQLAYYIIIYSGMQMLADRPQFYEGKYKKEFEFIKNVPLSFEKTVPLTGEIGSYYITARKDRESDNWYIGGITNEHSRRISLSFEYLDDAKYRAIIYSDSHDAHYQNNPTGIIVQNKIINKNSNLEIYLAPGGGFAVMLQKIN